jgi:DoxX-like family
LAETPKKWELWVGRVLTGLPSLMLVGSALAKLASPAEMVANFEKMGFKTSQLVPLGIVELTCVVLYLVPRTAIFGAILLTGYLGGAVVTHLRVGEPFFIPIVLGVMIWGGIYLREPRLRKLVPRSPDAS